MKFTIERNFLLKALNRVVPTITRATIPIMNNVMLTVRHGMLTLNTTDLDTFAESKTPCTDSVTGTITVFGKLFLAAVKALPIGAIVTCEVIDDKLHVTSGRVNLTLSTLPSDDFLVPDVKNFTHTFFIFAAELRQIIDSTRFAISTEEKRYYLNGIFLHVTDDADPVLKAAATDGHRIARYTTARPEGASGMPDIIVPRKCINELRKLLDEVDGTVEVSLSPSKIRFVLGAAVLTSKLIDGTYPDYSSVIPTGNDKVLRVDPKALARAVKQVCAIASEKTRAVKIAVERDKITLSVTSPENGTAAEEVSGDYSSDAIKIGFNARYLLDILAQMKGAECEIHFDKDMSPTLFVDCGDDKKTFVLMPRSV